MRKQSKMVFRNKLIGILFFFSGYVFSQNAGSDQIRSGSVFKNLKIHDSVVFYQCHVESGTQQLSTASGQTITGTPQKYSITEKFIITKLDNGYQVNYYTSSLNVFPNKKFAGLKFKERPYWDFKKAKMFFLQESELKPFLALEDKGRDAVVYDYEITRYNTNGLIIRYADDYKQLVVDGAYVLSKLINVEQR